MLTILAWMIFVPAMVLNLIVWCFMVGSAIDKRWGDFTRMDNVVGLFISAAFLFVPGVYLFGWW